MLPRKATLHTGYTKMQVLIQVLAAWCHSIQNMICWKYSPHTASTFTDESKHTPKAASIIKFSLNIYMCHALLCSKRHHNFNLINLPSEHVCFLIFKNDLSLLVEQYSITLCESLYVSILKILIELEGWLRLNERDQGTFKEHSFKSLADFFYDNINSEAQLLTQMVSQLFTVY